MKRVIIIMSAVLVLAGLVVLAVIFVRQRGLADMPQDVPSTQLPPPGTDLPAGQPPSPGGTTSPTLTDGITMTGVLPPGEDAPPVPTKGSSMDTDNDGLSDDEEALRGTDPRKADTDGDSLKDGEEVRIYCTDPKDSTTNGDQSDTAWVQSQQEEASKKGQRPRFCVN